MASRPVRFELVKKGPKASRSNRSARESPVAVASRDAYPRKRYPLVGPILDTARTREVRGVCGECDTRLKVTVQLPATVRCPVCGHSRRVKHV